MKRLKLYVRQKTVFLELIKLQGTVFFLFLMEFFKKKRMIFTGGFMKEKIKSVFHLFFVTAGIMFLVFAGMYHSAALHLKELLW